MTGSEFILLFFTVCNGLRLLAYVPQIVRAARDRTGVEALSFSTWALFLIANVSAVAYALVNKDDWAMAIVFLGNGLGCTTILLVGVWKRLEHRKKARGRGATSCWSASLI
ncbi:MAG TPA: PQ-loop domain-containing transporter [Hyphomicrobiaceae bacterium]|jgi:CHASE2 domain-containing sensor protein|nr:PQ-loop domain-containing transporter [Hyphomicrobiaceae bacterium]